MFRKMIVMAGLSFSLVASSPSKESDFITYEWLVDLGTHTSYTDHIPHFRRLFNTMKVRGFLECGCGYSTKYFMDHCDEVTSIEFMTKGTSDLWYNECLRLYADCSNWVPLAFNANLQNDSFDNACAYQCSIHRDYGLIDSKYLFDLDQYFKNLIYRAFNNGKEIDVAFVDAGVYVRGDMVKLLLLNKIPVVIAHDTENDVGWDVDEGLYGWFKVVTPPDYEKIYIPYGQGTTFWINKKYPKVIDSINQYRNDILQFGFSDLTKLEDQF